MTAPRRPPAAPPTTARRVITVRDGNATIYTGADRIDLDP